MSLISCAGRMLAGRLPRLPGLGAGAVALGALAAFLLLWGSVLIGTRVLIGTDILYQLPPWAGAVGAHAPLNKFVSDPVLQMLPWQGLASADFSAGRLPLWNPTVLSGATLMAQDQPATFSPFNLFALLFVPARGLSLAMLLKLWV